MNTSIEITHTDREQNGIFQAFEKGIAMGEITYAWSGKNTFIVTHTGVRPEFEGKGIAKKMFLEVIRYARENQKKIVPLCPFAKVMFERYDEFRDVLK
nr:GNAT family N-acetyltransferase [Capnocytophaga catalasegens]